MKKALGTILVFVVGAISWVVAKEVVRNAMTPSATNVASQVEEGLKEAVVQTADHVAQED